MSVTHLQRTLCLLSVFATLARESVTATGLEHRSACTMAMPGCIDTYSPSGMNATRKCYDQLRFGVGTNQIQTHDRHDVDEENRHIDVVWIRPSQPADKLSINLLCEVYKES